MLHRLTFVRLHNHSVPTHFLLPANSATTAWIQARQQDAANNLAWQCHHWFVRHCKPPTLMPMAQHHHTLCFSKPCLLQFGLFESGLQKKPDLLRSMHWPLWHCDDVYRICAYRLEARPHVPITSIADITQPQIPLYSE